MIKLRNITLGFKHNPLIDDGEMDILYGQVTLLIGESGSGKTTLLQEIGLLANRAHMEYELDGRKIQKCSEIEKTEIRKNDFSFIFQENNLFEHFNLIENLHFYANLYKHDIDEKMIHELLDFVDLGLDLTTRIQEMSGGERQRLAIVCGLIKESNIFIFDEPTSFLDEENRKKIMKLIQKLAYEKHKLVLVASHDQDFISFSDQIYQIENKKIKCIKSQIGNELKKESQKKQMNQKVLKTFVYKKFFKKNFMIGCIFTVILMFLAVIFLYGNELKQTDEQELLSSVHRTASIIRADGELMTVTEQAKIQQQFMEYNIYPLVDNLTISIKCGNIELENVDVKPYYPSSIDPMDILEEGGNESSIYVTYEVYRYLKNQDINQIQIANQDYIPKGILYPSYDTHKAIYVPYHIIEEYFKEKGIDIKNKKNKELIVEFNSLEDLRQISREVNKEYLFQTSQNISAQAQILHVFESGYIFITYILLFIIILVYRIYAIIDEKYETGLLKTMGVQNRDLIQIKILEEMYLFGMSLISSFILFGVSIWLFPSSYMYVCLLGGCIIFLLVITLIVYYLYISKKSIPMLMKKN